MKHKPIATALRAFSRLMTFYLLCVAGSSLVATGTFQFGQEAMASQSDPVSNASNDVRDIRITAQDEIRTNLEIDYVYDGSARGGAIIQIEFMIGDGTHDDQLTTSVGLYPGEGTRKMWMDRPSLEMEEFATRQIKVSFIAQYDKSVFHEEIFDIPVIWPSRQIGDRPEPLGYWRSKASQALSWKHYETLNRMFRNWNNPELRVLDGNWRLEAILKLVESNVGTGRWEPLYESIQEWKVRDPELPGPAITEAMYWVEYAWEVRGTGYSGNVTEVGRELFQERLKKAERVLLESRRYADSNPLWYNTYMRVALGLNRDKKDILLLFKEAVERVPSFDANYRMAVTALSPKWGGSYELMDFVANVAAQQLRKDEGDMAYARVYWSIDDALRADENLFEVAPVSWDRMKHGFEMLLDRYPQSELNQNAFLSFACRAGDGETYLHLRNHYPEPVSFHPVWLQGYTRDVCDHMFMQRT